MTHDSSIRIVRIPWVFRDSAKLQSGFFISMRLKEIEGHEGRGQSPAVAACWRLKKKKRVYVGEEKPYIVTMLLTITLYMIRLC